MLLRLLSGSAIASVGPGDAQELVRVGAVLVDVYEHGGSEKRPAGATEVLTKAGLDAVDLTGPT